MRKENAPLKSFKIICPVRSIILNIYGQRQTYKREISSPADLCHHIWFSKRKKKVLTGKFNAPKTQNYHLWNGLYTFNWISRKHVTLFIKIRSSSEPTGCLRRNAATLSSFSSGSMEQVLYIKTPPGFTNL